ERSEELHEPLGRELDLARETRQRHGAVHVELAEDIESIRPRRIFVAAVRLAARDLDEEPLDVGELFYVLEAEGLVRGRGLRAARVRALPTLRLAPPPSVFELCEKLPTHDCCFHALLTRQVLERFPSPGLRPETPPELPHVIEVAVSDGSHEEGEEQREELSADDHLRDRGTGSGPRPDSERDRDHAGYEHDRRHEDRPEARLVRLEDRRVALHTACAEDVRVVHLEDAVLLDDPEQEEEPEDGVDVERLAQREEREERERDR